MMIMAYHELYPEIGHDNGVIKDIRLFYAMHLNRIKNNPKLPSIRQERDSILSIGQNTHKER